MSSAKKSQISLSLPTEVVALLDRVADAQAQDRASVVERALARYLSDEGAEILNDAQGIEELDRDESIELDDVLEKARMIVETAERRHRRVG